MQIVITSRNQISYLEPMFQALKGFDAFCILDRCTDGSNRIKFPEGIRKVIKFEGSGFEEGKCRDLGAYYALSNESLLFLDGDKIPVGDLDYIEKFANESDFDCVLLGTENDPRGWINEGEGKVPWDISMFSDLNNQVYACGIYLSTDAISKIKHINGGRIFNANFDGKYGEEDRYLGDLLVFLGLKIGYTSKVKLLGHLPEFKEKIDSFSKNFIARLILRNDLKRRMKWQQK